jgi:hypothetical protein
VFCLVASCGVREYGDPDLGGSATLWMTRLASHSASFLENVQCPLDLAALLSRLKRSETFCREHELAARSAERGLVDDSGERAH